MSADDKLYDWIAAKWFPSGVSKSDGSRIGKLVRDLKVKRATVEMLERAHKNYRQVWPRMPDTPEAVVKHWDRMIAETQLTPTVTYGCSEADREHHRKQCKEDRERKAEREQGEADNWLDSLTMSERSVVYCRMADHVIAKHGLDRIDKIRSDTKLLTLSMWMYEVKDWR